MVLDVAFVFIKDPEEGLDVPEDGSIDNEHYYKLKN